MSENIDCTRFAIGDTKVADLVPGVLQHDGKPEAGDIIIYGHGLKYPTHVGIWQEDGTVESKWGDYGPVMKHKWDHGVPGFGKYVFFSKYHI